MFLFEHLRQSSENPVGPPNRKIPKPQAGQRVRFVGRPRPVPPSRRRKTTSKSTSNSSKMTAKNAKKKPKKSPRNQKKSKKHKKNLKKAKIPLTSAKISTKTLPQNTQKTITTIDKKITTFYAFFGIVMEILGVSAHAFPLRTSKTQKTAPKLGQNELKKTAQIIKKVCFFVIVLTVFVDDFCSIVATFVLFFLSFCVPIEALLWSWLDTF